MAAAESWPPNWAWNWPRAATKCTSSPTPTPSASIPATRGFITTKWKFPATRCSNIRPTAWRWPRAWPRWPKTTIWTCCTCTTPSRTPSRRCWRSRCSRPCGACRSSPRCTEPTSRWWASTVPTTPSPASRSTNPTGSPPSANTCGARPRKCSRHRARSGSSPISSTASCTSRTTPRREPRLTPPRARSCSSTSRISAR